MAVIGILYAIKLPIAPPIENVIINKTKFLNKISIDKKVTTIARSIPRIPKIFPIREVLGEDRPLKAKINNTPVIKYNNADKSGDIFSFLAFN
tara:strand:+ start:1102 stop:1380 length:279 start_codon:yes stop_codon:yes gene_type:complete